MAVGEKGEQRERLYSDMPSVNKIAPLPKRADTPPLGGLSVSGHHRPGGNYALAANHTARQNRH